MELANGNTTAIEAISERLSEVTALAEQLDRALTAARLDPAAPPPPPSVEDATDAPGEEPASSASSDPEKAASEDAAAAVSQAERSDATTTEVRLAGKARRLEGRQPLRRTVHGTQPRAPGRQATHRPAPLAGRYSHVAFAAPSAMTLAALAVRASTGRRLLPPSRRLSTQTGANG